MRTYVACNGSQDYFRLLHRGTGRAPRCTPRKVHLNSQLALMNRSRTIAATPLLILAQASVLHAQSQRAGNVSLDRTVYAKVYVDVGDALSPPMPIQGIRMLLVSATGDTVHLETDGAGATRAYVPRGKYQLMTLDLVNAAGKYYRWNVPVTVSPGMDEVVLSESNAAKLGAPTVAVSTGEVSTSGTGATISVPPPQPPPVEYAARRRVVDMSGFVWDVFQQEFSRGAVWGTSLALPKSEVMLVFNRDEETRQLEDFPKNWHSLPNDALAQLLAKAKRVRP